VKNHDSYMIYCGRGIPSHYSYELSEQAFFNFLDNQLLIDSFTVWQAIGYWKRHRENTFVIEVTGVDFDTIQNFCLAYIERFEQEDIWIKKINVDSRLSKGENNE
jgi:hypothetical protein